MRGYDLLSARRARVTGAGRGIGLAIVRALHRKGARIAVTDRDLDDARSAAKELGREARAFRLDVTDTRETEFRRR